ncbi:ESX secretion-associated protein EspG [Amycolatopsis sp. NPDC004378]
MTVLETPVTFTVMEFVTAWGMLDLGDPPPVVGTDIHFFVTDDERDELHTRTMDVLTRARLARRDRISPLWFSMLRLLALPEREFYALSYPDHHGVLVAAAGDHAARITATGGRVVVETVPAARLATSLLGTLPDVDGAPVRAVRVPRAVFESPPQAASVLDEEPDTADLDYLRAVMARERVAVHQLYTATRYRGERVASSPITALDLADDGGRVLTYLTGDEHIVLTPGTPRDVIKTLNDTAEALTG